MVATHALRRPYTTPMRVVLEQSALERAASVGIPNGHIARG
jgi:hypothetical protein